MKFFSEMPLKKLLLLNFLIGISIGFPFMIGTIMLTFGKNTCGLLVMLICVLFALFVNGLCYKKCKNKVSEKNIYSKLIYTFLFLGLGMICIMEISFLFMNIKM